MPDLREDLLNSIRVVDGADEFGDIDERWAETKQGEDRVDQSDNRAEVYVNHDAFKAAGAGEGYEEKVLLGESLHTLKNLRPNEYAEMETSALEDPVYLKWAQESYKHAVQQGGETRPFEDWHRISRFDQVIGGYLFAQDPDLPTMADWHRDDLPWGPGLRKDLEGLAKELGMQ